MNIIQNPLYQEDLQKIASQPLPWEQLKDRAILISGATGMIGSFLVDLLMYLNNKGLGCHIYAVGRNETKAQQRFSTLWNDPLFHFVCCDINQGLPQTLPNMDYIFHAASNTHPVAYATDPIGTVTTNIIGTYNLLEFAAQHNLHRFVFASTVEIYGENRGDTDAFSEEYCGYIDCNTLRAGYPESKRAGEALCQAYIQQKKLDVVIPRLSRIYGPTMLMSDTKALSQFIKKGIAGEDIVLKSEGTQFFSYTYVADAVSAILYCLFYGANGAAYNIGDAASDIALRDLAAIIANHAGKQVVFELPDAVEQAGYSKAMKAILCSKKLQALGWKAQYTIESGLPRTIEILKSLSKV